MKIINISGVIGWEVNAQDVRDALAAANGDEVQVHVSSPGGYISVGLEIFNLLRDYPGPISCVLKGYAMSMGSYIPLAVKLNRHAPGKIYAEDNAIYMIHNARGGVWGDHEEILGYGDSLKGMSTMIAKAYARHTGKPLDEITAMMNRTTYFFGDQIKEAGFVDEILETADADDSDEESALVTAKAVFEEMGARMVADQARMKADLKQVALALAASPEVTPPAAAGISTTEVQQTMTVKSLATLLAENPAAQTEHNALVEQARLNGEKAANDAAQARINGVVPFLANDKYPPAVAQTAIKVLKGEDGMTQANLTTVVAAVDAVREQAAADAAQNASQATPATPAAPVALVDPAALVSDDNGLATAVAMSKGVN